MFTFLHKEVSLESIANCGKLILTNFLFPASTGRDVKGVACRRTLFQKIMCSLLKLCSGQIEELKERIGRGRKGCLDESGCRFTCEVRKNYMI